MGRASAEGGRWHEAFAAYRTAQRFQAGFANAIYGEGQVLLMLRDYPTGWAKHESRWSVSYLRESPRHGDLPAWDGSSLTGRRILVWDEQGVGDKIMFAKAVPTLLEQSGNCVLEVEPRLVSLFARSFPTAEAVVSSQNPGDLVSRRGFDAQTSIGSLCRWLLPDPADAVFERGYLRPDQALADQLREHYRESFGGRPLIGVSWRGGTGKKKRMRSIPLRDLAPILRQRDCAFISLQHGNCAAEIAELHAGTGIAMHLDNSINALADLDRFAAQTAAMDLVITIDNSTAHMAGALGVSVWVMLPVVPEWRWQLDRDDSPWYQSARLFRQKARGDWTPAIQRIAADLRQFRPAQHGVAQ
ncbi:MAG: hypothetical protein ACREEE_10250 [Dongiaceae bacterium]